VNHPTPAIVSQAAARRLPRLALLLFCVAYVLPGFIGRDAWKTEDMAALGFMTELLQGSSQWDSPSLMGAPSESAALLPYWLGVWAMQWAPSWMEPDFAVRIPFGLLMALALTATWYGTYYLGRSPKAQPVAFAFGGEASPASYARAMADGGLLAFIACLGLAQLSHESTPALAQLGFAALFYFGVSALPYHSTVALLAWLLGITGLTLSGAPCIALLWGLGSAFIHFLDRARLENTVNDTRNIYSQSVGLFVGSAVVAALGYGLNLWRWKLDLPGAHWADWSGYAQLLIWFTWPAWPLALWTVWRWRHQLFTRHISRHLALPFWLSSVSVAATLTTGSSDRTLLLALPALATLAAFALPTLKRSVAALIDWFTLLFFSGCGLVIWVVWIAMQTGIPSQPAANVARLAPGFEASFSFWTFGIAFAATIVWAWLVHWRVGRHRAAIWKSLVLPAGGAALCWLLLMTLWMPLLNYSQGYKVLVKRTVTEINPSGCVETLGLGQGQIAAFLVYGNVQLRPVQHPAVCAWLLTEAGNDMAPPSSMNTNLWNLVMPINHPTDMSQSVLLFKRR
jgi:4-amino-4-deoxy-L-arabinose transferase-like glycosyltransferase